MLSSAALQWAPWTLIAAICILIIHQSISIKTHKKWNKITCHCSHKMIKSRDPPLCVWQLFLYYMHAVNALFQGDIYIEEAGTAVLVKDKKETWIMSPTFPVKDCLFRQPWVMQLHRCASVPKVGIRIEVKGDFFWWVCGPGFQLFPSSSPSCVSPPSLRPLCLLYPPGIRLITKATLILPRTL